MSLEELQFLTKKSELEEHDKRLQLKISRLSRTLIGRELKLKESDKIESIPVTSYNFYAPFFQSRAPDALMFPPDQYEECATTGTMGIPKRFLIPKSFLRDSLQTLKANFVTTTIKQGRPTFEKGDTFYINAAPKPFITGVLVEYVKQELEPYARAVPPDQGRPFAEKTQYFIEHYGEIHMALMPLVVLLHAIYPRVGRPLNLKGFIPFDTAAEAYKDRAHEIVGCRLSGAYASTETVVSTIASAEHELGFMFDPRSIHCEYLPFEDLPTDGREDVNPKKLLPGSDLKKGKRYLMIVTPFNGELTRYNTGDVLEVVDGGDSVIGAELPVLKFVSRASKVIILENWATISEAELLLALSRAKTQYTEFTARLEVEEGKHYLAIYLETDRPSDINETKDRINQSLQALDPDYGTLIRSYNYQPLKITLLSKGAFAHLLISKKGFPKVDRINMVDRDLKLLLEMQQTG